jgi:LysR family transcriptional regulator, regulator of gene expression of beta-lactamase
MQVSVMSLDSVSLNSLRAFATAARHLSFTGAGKELFVTQAAVAHQVKALEAQLGVQLFRRTGRGLVLTDEGNRLAPVLGASFSRIEQTLAALSGTKPREILTVGVVGTFAIGFLFERLAGFRALHPHIELRIATNNNKVDLWTEALDLAIRFGDGSWHGVAASPLIEAPLAPLCAPAMAARLSVPGDLALVPLLRSYRTGDWPAWFTSAGVEPVAASGPVFDASTLMVQAAELGEGVALAPASMFQRAINQGHLVQPFETTVSRGSYWLTRLNSKEVSPTMAAFQSWLESVCATG